MGGRFQGDESCGCEVRLKGKFSYTDTGDPGPMRNVLRVTGDLVWAKREEESTAAASGNAERFFFTPTDGEITVEMEFENHGLEGASVCKGSGRKTFPVDSMARDALKHMLLEVTGDGGYELTLVIPDRPDPFPRWGFEATCIWPNITSTDRIDVHSVSVILGKQRGMVDEQQGIAGQLAAPIRRGPRTITGSWSFSSADH
jgi:hypothetical protein